MKRTQTILAAAFLIIVTMQSCSKEEGCTDVTACNFNTEAEDNDESCTYATTWYQDVDGDGLGNPHATTSSCGKPAGYVDNATDAADLAVQKKQRAIVTYYGATWCPPCGAYGDPTKEHMESKYGSDVIILNSQGAWQGDAISSKSSFGCMFGNAFTKFVKSTSAPYGFWSGANYAMKDRGFYTSSSTNNSKADTDIDAIIANSPVVGVAAQASFSGNTINIQTLAKFYNASGEHYIGVYLLEDGVDAKQKISGAADAITSHENVIRAAASTGNTLGTESMGTSFAANQEVSGNYTITVPSKVKNKANLQIAVVIWEANLPDGISNAIIVDVN